MTTQSEEELVRFVMDKANSIDDYDWGQEQFEKDLRQNIQTYINGEKIKLLEETIEKVSVNQKGQFEDDAGYICWYLDDLKNILTAELNQLKQEEQL